MTNKTEPEATPGLSQRGATFAERAGKKPPTGAAKANSTFADRAKAVGKAVKPADAEDKSVSASETKSQKG